MVLQMVGMQEKSDSFLFSLVSDERDPKTKELYHLDDIPFHFLIHFKEPFLLDKNFSLALVSNNTLLVNAGGSSFVSTAHLNTIDFKNEGTIFLYMLRATPKFGDLKLNGEVILPDQTFTQEDIDNQTLTYHHNPECTAAKDFFIFSIIIEDGTPISNDAFPKRTTSLCMSWSCC